MPFSCLPFFKKSSLPGGVVQMNPVRKTTLHEAVRRHPLAHEDYRATLIAALERHHTQLSRTPIPRGEPSEHRAAELHYAQELTRLFKNPKIPAITLQRILNETFISLDRHCKRTKLSSQIRDLIAALEDHPIALSSLGLTHIFPREAGDKEYHLLLRYRVNLAHHQAILWLDGKPHYHSEKIHAALCESLTHHHTHLARRIADTRAEQGQLLLMHSGSTEALFKSEKKIKALQEKISAKVEEGKRLQKEQLATANLITVLNHHMNKEIDPAIFESHLQHIATLGACCELARFALYLNHHDEGFKQTYTLGSAPVADDFPDWDFVAGGSFSSESSASVRASSGSAMSTPSLSFKAS